MKVVLQVVKNARCVIDGVEHSKINRGFLIFVGFTNGDDETIIDKIVHKILKLRIFEDQNGKTNLSLNDINGEILSISQFTLYADIKKGNRPSFVDALEPSKATILYDIFNKKLAESNFIVKTGLFGANMKIELVNDGPFTIIIDSKEM